MDNRREKDNDMGSECKITLKDAYNELWRCRDFELTHFWQRSVFLGTFFLAVFTGYGAVMLNCLEHGLANRPAVNCLCFGLSMIGIVLSFLWIMMAKGAKAWYERYEMAITHFLEIACVERKELLFEDGAEKISAFAYNKGFTKYSAPVSSWIWNTKGGSYSPSKINIALGHLSLLIWLCLAIVHISVARGSAVSKVLEIKVGIPEMMFLIITLGLLLFWIYSKMSLKSEMLAEK